MKIAPQTTVVLYKNVDIGPGVIPTWSSPSNRSTYFAGKRHPHCPQNGITVPTIKQKYGEMKLPIAPIVSGVSGMTGKDISECNMISYINQSFDNTVIYARILDYDYSNNECVVIKYMIDYWITWLFDVDFLDMYIERQHLSVADWNKAETNPYDPDIAEFKTPEPLSVDKQFEKPFYNILNWSSAANPVRQGYDGTNLLTRCKMTQTDVEHMMQGDLDFWAVLVYLSPIDFDDLGPEAEEKWDDWGVRDYKIYDPTWKTSRDPYQGTEANIMAGSFWSGMNPATEIYCFTSNAKAGVQPPNYAFESMIMLLTGWQAISQIVGMYLVPRQIVEAAGMQNLTIDNSSWNEYAHTWNELWARLMSEDVMNDFTSAASDQQVAVRNKKLLNFPFSYLRVSTSKGEKEYHYEDFYNVVKTNNPENVVRFRLLATLVGGPKLILVPQEYRENVHNEVTLPSESSNLENSFKLLTKCNIDEALVFSDFPQLEFNTDGYLTYLASEYMGMRSQDTSTYQMQVANERAASNEAASLEFLNLGGAALSVASGNLGDVTRLGQSQSNLENYSRSEKMMNDLVARMNESENWVNNTSDYAKLAGGEEINTRYNATRPAHANSIYHPGTSISSLLTLKGMGGFNLTSLHVQLRSEILSRYDKFFDMFGYDSGNKCDIPYALRFVMGQSQDAQLPHWATVNGKPTTYLKTRKAKVEHAMQPVADGIAQMLDSGIRFINCDPT